MVYHVPTMLKKYGNLKQFSGQLQGIHYNNKKLEHGTLYCPVQTLFEETEVDCI